MATLIIPAAGLSTRYNLGRPKFLLQHPSGSTMLEQSILGLGNLASHGITSITIVSLAEYFHDFSEFKLQQRIEKLTGIKTTLYLIQERTTSMVETICKALELLESDEEVIVKDCDNYVTMPPDFFSSPSNAIAFADLKINTEIQPSNKSFLKINDLGCLDHIVEKRIISEFINVGCVKFAKASDFLAAAKSLNTNSEVYVSDVIRVLLKKNSLFRVFEIVEYIDWGTQEEWLDYCAQFATYFVDLDGVLVKNENPVGTSSDWGDMRPIQENLDCLVKIQKRGKSKIIITSSRSEENRKIIQETLSAWGLGDVQIILGLLHARRVLINDFAPTNPFPSAVAINLERNSQNLSNYI